MCKAKSCKYWKQCLVKRELVGDTRCGDFERNSNYKPKEVKKDENNRRNDKRRSMGQTD